MSWLTAAITSAVLYGLWGFMSKVSSQQLGANNALIYQALGGALVAVVLAAYKKFDISSSSSDIVHAIAVGALGMIATLFFLFSLTKGKVSIVNTIVALSPVVTIILAITFLKEKLSLTQGGGVALAIIAVLLLTRH